MHVVCGGPDVQHVVRLDLHLLSFLCKNRVLRPKQLLILVFTQLIVLKLLFNFVVADIVQSTIHKSEENRHIGMIMQRHNSSLFNEEQNKSVVCILLVDRDAV